MDAATASVYIAGLSAISATIGVYMQTQAVKAREKLQATVDETAARGKAARLVQEAMAATVDDVHAQVVTLNAGTVGSFASDDETRRVAAIPHDDRTAAEQHHLESAPDPGPPIGPAR